MSIWTDFVSQVCNSDITWSDTFDENISHIAVGKSDDILDFGFYGKEANEFANCVIDWVSSNHPLGINEELTNFIRTWGNVDSLRQPRLGLNITRSSGSSQHSFYNSNTVCFGGSMPYDCWWFFDDYDIPGQFANTSQAIEAVSGGIKLYYDLNEERFVTLKTYTKNKNSARDTLGNRAFAVNANNDLTLVAVDLCYEPPIPSSASDYSGRFESEIDTMFQIKDTHHNPEWHDEGNNSVKSIITMKFAEKVGNANTIPTTVDRGGFIFTLTKFQRTGADLPPVSANTVINNLYRLKPYDSFIE